MNALPRKWMSRVGVLLGVAGMLTSALLELGWLPEAQGLKALIFLMGFMVADGAARESSEAAPTPSLLTSSEDFFRSLSGLLSETNHEILAVVRGTDVMREDITSFIRKTQSTIRSKKQLHGYFIVAAPIGQLSEESFQRRSSIERDASLEGRYHYRFVDTAVSFGCFVYDEKHWAIDFPPNPEDPRGGAILFENYPQAARLVASFIRHQWLERPGVTMSLGEAYEKWKTFQPNPSS